MGDDPMNSKRKASGKGSTAKKHRSSSLPSDAKGQSGESGLISSQNDPASSNTGGMKAASLPSDAKGQSVESGLVNGQNDPASSPACKPQQVALRSIQTSLLSSSQQGSPPTDANTKAIADQREMALNKLTDVVAALNESELDESLIGAIREDLQENLVPPVFHALANTATKMKEDGEMEVPPLPSPAVVTAVESYDDTAAPFRLGAMATNFE